MPGLGWAHGQCPPTAPWGQTSDGDGQGDIVTGLSADSEHGSAMLGHGKPPALAQPSAREESGAPHTVALLSLRCRSSWKGCTRTTQGTCPFFPFSHAPSQLMERTPGRMVPHTGLSLWVLPRLLWKGGSRRMVMLPSVPILQAPSALCHPLHRPLPAWGHPLHSVPSRGNACAEPCPVPPGSPWLPAAGWGLAAALPA